jgi:flagellar basal-body rod protein FlgF
MSDIFQIASVGLLQGRQQLEAISMNAASATLPGYKRQVPAAAFATVLGALDTDNRVDLRRGEMMATGRPLDVAIDADDVFFAVTDAEQTWLTRAGSFHLDASGVLIGERGLKVLGTQGELRLPSSDVNVSADGRITHDGLVVGSLQLFRPTDHTSLQTAGGSLLKAAGGIEPASSVEVRLRSGMLEASNTDPGREMIDLMALSRQFESLSRIVQGYDEVLGRTLQKLGEI